MSIQAPASDWQFVSGSWIGITDESGSNQNPDKDPASALPFRAENQTTPRRRILIVEDNPADVFLIRTALETADIEADIQVVKDGEQATLLFDRADRDASVPCPSLVILDVNLPKKQGDDVLQHLRKSRRCLHAPVLAVSTSDSARDRQTMIQLGANGYFHKPSEYAAFMRLGDMVKDLLSA